MRHLQFSVLAVFWLSAPSLLLAVTHYVGLNSANPMPPYTSWATAATNIQDAVDAAVAGDQILVTNGVYQTGGKAVSGTMTNRVAVDKPVTILSMNGPQFTIIKGYQVPGAINSDGAIRCVYLTNGASLSGFTLTGGATRTDGQYPGEQCGGGAWCESSNELITNCIIAENSAASGGGGVYGGLLMACTLKGNSTGAGGGGAASATLNNCAIINNTAYYGGGAYSSILNNCNVTGNSAGPGGGGGGVDSCKVNNSIVYYNSAPGKPDYANHASSFPINYSCTAPLSDSLGVGNISAEPKLASASHLSAASPCRGAGSSDDVAGTDIDGEAWAHPPSMGCDEFHAGSADGHLTAAFTIALGTVGTNSPLTFPAFLPVTLTAFIEGQVIASVWNFGDGTVLSNQPYASHVWSAPGDYSVVLRAYNDSSPEGVSAEITVHVVEQFVYYVAADNPAPVPPFNSWSSAATNIQDAVDAALPGSLVLVTNGIYRTGGRPIGGANCRVVVTNRLTIRSINGMDFTRIEGRIGTRCVYLENGSSLAGFTLTNGNLMFQSSGGGVLFGNAPSDAVVSNCVITACAGVIGGGGAALGQGSGPPGLGGGTFVNCTFARNQATGISFGFPFPPTLGGAVVGCRLINCTLTRNGAAGPGAAAGGGAHASILQNCILTGNSVTRGSGGGASGSILINCLLTGNSAGSGSGGGVSGSSLTNCTLTANAATNEGGGASAGTLHNCILFENTASSNANYTSGTTLNFSCTSPMPASGLGNITNAPLFVDLTNENLRLQSNSPCINAGDNDYVTSLVDLAGWERIVGGTVDMGAYEWIDRPTHYVSLTSPNPTPPFLSWTTAATSIQGAVYYSEVGHRILVTNGVYQTGGAYVMSGDGRGDTRLLVTSGRRVESVNGPSVTSIVGYQVPGITNGPGAVRCAYLEDGALLAGFTLTNGATSYQSLVGGGVYCDPLFSAVVSNCVIVGNAAADRGGGASSGMLKNCIIAGNATRWAGGGTYLSKLDNCVITGNRAQYFGGGVFGGTLTNCVLRNNDAGSGGGAAGLVDGICTLINCTLEGNTAFEGGGAAYIVSLQSCLVRGNSAYQGGGIYGSNLDPSGVNCLVVENRARGGRGGGAYGGSLGYSTVAGNGLSVASGGAGIVDTYVDHSIVYYNTNIFRGTANYAGVSSLLVNSCTTPLPTAGSGNITYSPLFVDRANGNFRLQANSPCINSAGQGGYPGGFDLDGNPRNVGGSLDMGAYEFQSPSSVLSYAWAQQYGLPTDGSADYADSDGDQANNWQEWMAGTVPTDTTSALRLLNPSNDVSGVIVSWQSVSNRMYFLERANHLGAQPPFSHIASNILGHTGTTSFTDTNATGPGPFFYRVGVQQ